MQVVFNVIIFSLESKGFVFSLFISELTEAKNIMLPQIMMKMVYKQFSGKKFDKPIPKEGKARVKAIHYIQSFDPPDNVSAEKAFAIAKAFVREAFGMDCQSVIVTHTDKEHIHNHIIINSYDISGKKFYDNKETLRKLRQISDEVCSRYGIKPYDKSKGREQTMPYNEWQHRKNKTSWKQKIREKIDELIPLVQPVDEFLSHLQEEDFEVKRGKYFYPHTLWVYHGRFLNSVL